jgi:hypothetical protein
MGSKQAFLLENSRLKLKGFRYTLNLNGAANCAERAGKGAALTAQRGAI